MRRTIVCLLVLSGLLACGEDLRPSSKDLEGLWKSECVSPGPGQGIRLSFDIGRNNWTLDYDVYGDTACANANLRIHIEGPYELGKASEALAGAREARFGFGTRTLTAQHQGAATFVEQTCGISGLEPGSARDFAGGCAALGVYPISECMWDYDIVRLEGDVLSFGMRPTDNNMCTPDKRPTQSGIPLRRQP